MFIKAYQWQWFECVVCLLAYQWQGFECFVCLFVVVAFLNVDAFCSSFGVN